MLFDSLFFIHDNNLKRIRIGYFVIIFKSFNRWLWLFFKCVEEVIQITARNNLGVIICKFL